MHLTRFTDLSLRVLIYLTHNERKGLVTVTELAERFKWSRNHMVKVVHFMSTKNWVQEALQKPLFPSRIEQNRSVRFFFTTSKNGVFFAIKIV